MVNVFSDDFVEWQYFNTTAILYRRLHQMGLLNKEQILAARNTRKTEIVETPEWGGSVLIIELSGKERDAFEADMVQLGTNGQQKINLRNIRAKLAARCIVNPDDFDVNDNVATLKSGHTPSRLFNDIETNDLGDVSATALQRVFECCQHLSGITKEDVKELVGELKNDQSADFGLN